jgi:hypothetical protein
MEKLGAFYDALVGFFLNIIQMDFKFQMVKNTLANDQLDAQIFNTFTIIPYMFRAIFCSFSEG